MNNYNKLFDSSFFNTPQKNNKENNTQRIFNPSQNIFGSGAVPSISGTQNGTVQPAAPGLGTAGQSVFGQKPATPFGGTVQAPQGTVGAFGSAGFGGTASPFGNPLSTPSLGPATGERGLGTAGTPFFGQSAGTALGSSGAGASTPFGSGFGSGVSGTSKPFGMETKPVGLGSSGILGPSAAGHAVSSQSSSGGIFGNLPPAHLAGTNAPQSIFGSSASHAAPASAFLGPCPPQPQGVFGAAQTAVGIPGSAGSTGSVSPFGAAGVASGPFARTGAGMPASPFTQGAFAQPGGLFGNTSSSGAAVSSKPGLFGDGAFSGTGSPSPVPPMQQPSTTSRLFGAVGPGLSKGTRDPRYHDSRVREDSAFVNIKHICAMKEYQNKDVPELRLEDYDLGRKGVSTSPEPVATQVFPSQLFSPQQQTAPPQVMQQQVQPLVAAVVPEATQPAIAAQNKDLCGYQVASMSDPFLIDEIKVEKMDVPQKVIRRKIPKPDFRRADAENVIKITLREPAVKAEVETIPSQADIKKMESVSLVVMFKEGRVEYLEPIKSADALLDNIESKIFFGKDDVSVNDPVGVGLNKRARVYVNNYFPFMKSKRSFVRDDVLVYELRKDRRRKFIEYDKESGLYVYEVNHF